eukprot:108913_1
METKPLVTIRECIELMATDDIIKLIAAEYTALMAADLDDTLLCDHTGERLAYKQWKIDPNDTLLLSGYEKCYEVRLPSDVRNIIGSFCGNLKKYTMIIRARSNILSF